MNSRIRKTKAYNKLSKIQLKIYRTTKHLEEIQRAYHITKREGITFGTCTVHRRIVEELIEEDKKEFEDQKIICECGQPASKGFDPCCSLDCWHEQFEN